MQIVILGAGYAGLRTALDLDRLLRQRGRDDVVTLIDQFGYHQLIQVLHLVATAAHETREAIYDLPVLLSRGGVRFVQGQVATICPPERCVRLADGSTVGYDRLVIALGAEADYHNVPGAREHGLPLHSVEHALRLRNHIVDQYRAAAKAADPKAQRILMTTAIVGGGYTGCQLAGELAAWADDLCQDTGTPRREVRIALLERGHLLLKQFGEWATRQAESVLDSLGVSIYLDTPVEWLEHQAIHVVGGRVLRAGTIVWAGGIKGPDLLHESGLSVDDHGRVFVDRYLRVRDQALIFAMGDCAAVPDGSGGFTLPSTASLAMRQGQHMADTLLAEIEGRPPRTYEPLKLGELVSIGPHYAVGNPLGMPVSGYPAVVMKKGVEQYYRATLEGPLA